MQWFIPGHTASEWHSQDWNLNLDVLLFTTVVTLAKDHLQKQSHFLPRAKTGDSHQPIPYSCCFYTVVPPPYPKNLVLSYTQLCCSIWQEFWLLDPETWPFQSYWMCLIPVTHSSRGRDSHNGSDSNNNSDNSLRLLTACCTSGTAPDTSYTWACSTFTTAQWGGHYS